MNTKNFNRFDFEQQIMSCWNVTTDMKDVAKIVSSSEPGSGNILVGLVDLYEHRFSKLFSMFESMVREQNSKSEYDHLSIYAQAARNEAKEMEAESNEYKAQSETMLKRKNGEEDIIHITGDWHDDMCEVFNLATWNGNRKHFAFQVTDGVGVYAKFLGGHDPLGKYLKLGPTWGPHPDGGFQHKLPPHGTTHVIWYPKEQV